MIHLLTNMASLYLVVLEEDSGADGVEQNPVGTPAELVAQRVV